MWIEYITDFMENIGINNIFDVLKMVIDISAASVLIYWAIISLKNTRAYRLLKGVFVIILLTFISQLLELRMISYILTNLMTYGALVIIVIFQPELRKTLEGLGKRKFKDVLILEEIDKTEVEVNQTISEVCRAVEILSSTYTGALIVVERDIKLDDVIKTGTKINSDVSGELLVNIFTPNTPLHDGAVILRNQRLIAAGCILPLTENNELSKELGTRHRAGIGITESSDALVIIVSEETGKISLAIDGGLTRNIDSLTLKTVLNKVWVKPTNTKNTKSHKINLFKNKKSTTKLEKAEEVVEK